MPPSNKRRTQKCRFYWKILQIICFRKYKNLIIDCSEIEIETPNDLEIQSAAWSDSSITTLCEADNLCCSKFFCYFNLKGIFKAEKWQKLTIKSECLDLVPVQIMILTGKCFGILDKCVAGSIYFMISPGQKGMF